MEVLKACHHNGNNIYCPIQAKEVSFIDISPLLIPILSAFPYLYLGIVFYCFGQNLQTYISRAFEASASFLGDIQTLIDMSYQSR